MSRFNYFGYASNLSLSKVALRCKSCKFIGIGKLLNHHIDFGEYRESWRGGTATVIPEEGKVVLGAIWSIEESEMDILDRQEGHDTSGDYKAITIQIEDENGGMVACRAYEQAIRHGKQSDPSPQYMAIILEGAKSRSLPKSYIEMLEKVKTNDNKDITDIMIEIREKRKTLGEDDLF